MVRNLQLSKIFWLIPTVCAFLAALAGVLTRGLYTGLFPPDFLPGAFPQDVLTLLVCGLLFFLIGSNKPGDVKAQVVIVGLIGSFFYLYGIFTMERVYNAYYLLYAAIFASSFWSVLYSLAGFDPRRFAGLQLSRAMRLTTAVLSILIAVLFTFLWVSALIPLMQAHDRIDFLYSIYILDLCFVMPAFVMTAIMALRGMPLGVLLGPAIMILGFFVIFPLGLNELAKPAAGLPMNTGSLIVSFGFALLMLVVGGLQLRLMRVE